MALDLQKYTIARPSTVSLSECMEYDRRCKILRNEFKKDLLIENGLPLNDFSTALVNLAWITYLDDAYDVMECMTDVVENFDETVKLYRLAEKAFCS
jgi:hypothetical protein